MHERIVFPLDVATEAEAWEWCLRLKGKVGVMKIGLQVFTECGPKILSAAKANGFKVFLDLKLHDIPNTVKGATQSAVGHGVDFLSVHTSGGPAMMKAAVEAAEGSATTILGITALTSLGSADMGRIFRSRCHACPDGWSLSDTQELVTTLAKIGHEAGGRGFVCSPQEVATLKHQFPDATFVVPGIRPSGSATQDQKRVATPYEAVKDGADYLVIGRPIRNAADPSVVCDSIAEDIAKALKQR